MHTYKQYRGGDRDMVAKGENVSSPALFFIPHFNENFLLGRVCVVRTTLIFNSKGKKESKAWSLILDKEQRGHVKLMDNKKI